MRFVFLEAPLFTRLLPAYLADDEYRALQWALMQQPEWGDLIPNTGGFRKVRWRDQRRGKGKQGGLRIVYYVLAADRQIWLFTIYDKNEVQDLTPQQCRLLKNAIHDELAARRSGA